MYVYLYTTFKVIIKHPSETGDERTYYGIVLLKDGKSKSKKIGIF